MKEEVTGEPIIPVQRLCSEIQLFDLCELDSCHYKKKHFCTNEELLQKFESIKEEDDQNTLLYEEDEIDDDSESDFDDNDYAEDADYED